MSDQRRRQRNYRSNESLSAISEKEEYIQQDSQRYKGIFWQPTIENQCGKQPIQIIEDEIFGEHHSSQKGRRFNRNKTKSESVDCKKKKNEESIDEDPLEKEFKLSQEVRRELVKIKKFDKCFSLKKTEKDIQDSILREMKRFGRVKNRNRKLKEKETDNELTISAIYQLMKMLSQLRDEIQKKENDRKQGKSTERQRFGVNKRRLSDEAEMQKLVGSIKKMLEYDSRKELKSTVRKLVDKYGEDEYFKESIHLYEGLQKTLEEKEKIIEEIHKQRKNTERLQTALNKLERQSKKVMNEEDERLKNKIKSLSIKICKGENYWKQEHQLKNVEPFRSHSICHSVLKIVERLRNDEELKRNEEEEKNKFDNFEREMYRVIKQMSKNESWDNLLEEMKYNRAYREDRIFSLFFKFEETLLQNERQNERQNDRQKEIQTNKLKKQVQFLSDRINQEKREKEFEQKLLKDKQEQIKKLNLELIELRKENKGYKVQINTYIEMQDLLKEEIRMLKERITKEKKEFENHNLNNQYQEKIKKLLHENIELNKKNEEFEKRLGSMILEISSKKSRRSIPKPLEQFVYEDVKIDSFVPDENERELSRGENLTKEWKKYRHDYNNSFHQSEAQTIQKINFLILDLVQVNRQQQIKINLLESHSHSPGKHCKNLADYFSVLENKMENLMVFLVDKQYIANGENYLNFISKAETYLNKGEEEEYFRKWFQFMKELFVEVHKKRQKELSLRTKYVDELRERMDNIIENRKQNKSIPEVVKQLQKYKFVVGELRCMMQEYLLKENMVYMKMMCNHLGIKIH